MTTKKNKNPYADLVNAPGYIAPSGGGQASGVIPAGAMARNGVSAASAYGAPSVVTAANFFVENNGNAYENSVNLTKPKVYTDGGDFGTGEEKVEYPSVGGDSSDVKDTPPPESGGTGDEGGGSVGGTGESYYDKMRKYYAELYSKLESDAEASKNMQIGKAEDRYQGAVAESQAAYQRALSTYGSTAEGLSRMGLTGSGYSDYLSGKAYETQRKEQIAAGQARGTAIENAENAYRDALLTNEKDKADKMAGIDAAETEAKATLYKNLLELANGGILDETALRNMAKQNGIEFDDETWGVIKTTLETGKENNMTAKEQEFAAALVASGALTDFDPETNGKELSVLAESYGIDKTRDFWKNLTTQLGITEAEDGTLSGDLAYTENELKSSQARGATDTADTKTQTVDRLKGMMNIVGANNVKADGVYNFAAPMASKGSTDGIYTDWISGYGDGSDFDLWVKGQKFQLEVNLPVEDETASRLLTKIAGGAPKEGQAVVSCGDLFLFDGTRWYTTSSRYFGNREDYRNAVNAYINFNGGSAGGNTAEPENKPEEETGTTVLGNTDKGDTSDVKSAYDNLISSILSKKATIGDDGIKYINGEGKEVGNTYDELGMSNIGKAIVTAYANFEGEIDEKAQRLLDYLREKNWLTQGWKPDDDKKFIYNTYAQSLYSWADTNGLLDTEIFKSVEAKLKEAGMVTLEDAQELFGNGNNGSDNSNNESGNSNNAAGSSNNGGNFFTSVGNAIGSAWNSFTGLFSGGGNADKGESAKAEKDNSSAFSKLSAEEKLTSLSTSQDRGAWGNDDAAKDSAERLKYAIDNNLLESNSYYIKKGNARVGWTVKDLDNYNDNDDFTLTINGQDYELEVGYAISDVTPNGEEITKALNKIAGSESMTPSDGTMVVACGDLYVYSSKKGWCTVSDRFIASMPFVGQKKYTSAVEAYKNNKTGGFSDYTAEEVNKTYNIDDSYAISQKVTIAAQKFEETIILKEYGAGDYGYNLLFDGKTVNMKINGKTYSFSLGSQLNEVAEHNLDIFMSKRNLSYQNKNGYAVAVGGDIVVNKGGKWYITYNKDGASYQNAVNAFKTHSIDNSSATDDPSNNATMITDKKANGLYVEDFSKSGAGDTMSLYVNGDNYNLKVIGKVTNKGLIDKLNGSTESGNTNGNIVKLDDNALFVYTDANGWIEVSGDEAGKAITNYLSGDKDEPQARDDDISTFADRAERIKGSSVVDIGKGNYSIIGQGNLDSGASATGTEFDLKISGSTYKLKIGQKVPGNIAINASGEGGQLIVIGGDLYINNGKDWYAVNSVNSANDYKKAVKDYLHLNMKPVSKTVTAYSELYPKKASNAAYTSLVGNNSGGLGSNAYSDLLNKT